MDNKKLRSLAIAAGIVVFAALIMIVLIKQKKSPRTTAPDNLGVLVRTVSASPETWRVTVSGTATVQPTQEISIMPQVSGLVSSTSPGFYEGGFFKKGRVLFELDRTDYELALRGAEAAEARAEYELETIKSRADIARREWKIMTGRDVPRTPDNNTDQETGREAGQDRPAESAPNPLVLYEPQLKNARAALQSASATVELARLNLQRTTVRAPFDCRVRSKSIDLGQYVKSGTPVATVAGTASAEVIVPLEQSELRWIDIPMPGKPGRGSDAHIAMPGNAQGLWWEGRVVRSAGEVDMKSRMVQLVIEVRDPYGLKARTPKPPLLNGSFVNVSISGKSISGAYAVPRSALRDDSTVWIMDSDNLLEIREVRIERMEGDKVIIGSGLEAGDRIVLTKISGAANGMKLRHLKPEPDPASLPAAGLQPAPDMQSTPAPDTGAVPAPSEAK